MEDRNRKFNYSPSQNVYLQSEIRMLEERLKNLDYLKQTYERNAREKAFEIDGLSIELHNTKAELHEKTRIIEEMSQVHCSNEATLLKVIEEHRTNKVLLEEELLAKSVQISQLEKSLREQYDQSLRILDENQELRKEMKNKEGTYAEHIGQLEEKLYEITVSQKLTEERVNNIFSHATPKKKKTRIRKEEPGQLYRKELALNKSLKNIITDLYRQKPQEIEERLLNSEKKIRELESILSSTSKTELYSPMTTLKTTAKLRSSSQNLKPKSRFK